MSAGLTAPLTQALDGSWRIALAGWSIPGFVGAGLWWLMLKRTARPHAVKPIEPAVGLPWRQGKAWLAMTFFGTQSIVFYVVLAWLAPMYVELGWSASRAGTLLGIWVGAQFVAILSVAHFASRSRDRRPWLLACSVAAIVSFVGFAVAPLAAPWIWVVLLSIACGGWFPLAMTLPLDYSRTPNETGSWTAMMLFGGYLISAASPSLADWARDYGASYSSIFASMAALSLLVLGLAAFLRPRTLEVADQSG